MQKYENHIHEFLLQQKEISLERIGHFTLEGEEVSFSFDKKAVTTPAFIQYVADHVKKNAVLVETNIASHLEQARQFVNLGKPYHLPGIGDLSITRAGAYVFTPQFSSSSLLDEEEEQQIISSEPAERERKKRNVMWLAIIIGLIVVGAGGYGLYSYISSNRSTSVPVSENATNETEVPVDSIATDSISKRPDSSAMAVTPLGPSDSVNFRFIIEQTFNARRARSRTVQLQTLKININLDSAKRGDSTLYRLYFIKKAAPKDTARINDSLKIWYSSRRVVAERMQ